MKTTQLKSLFHDFVCNYVRYYPTTFEETEIFENDYNKIIELIDKLQAKLAVGGGN